MCCGAITLLGGVIWWITGQSERKAPPPQPVGENVAVRPNIILIYTDDIDCESVFTTWPGQPSDLIRFPNLKRLAQEGTVFSNFHVTTPVCGPSRASLLSGQYAHRNGIRVNTPGVKSANGFGGGYPEFNRENEMGIWMKGAGYRTAFVGKYLHDGFTPSEEKQQTWKDMLPRGWDHFICHLGGNYYGFGQVNSKNGKINRIHNQYRTDTEASIVSEMISTQFANSNRPFCLCWAPYAAHIPVKLEQMTASRHAGMYEDEIPSGFRDAERFATIENQPDELRSIPSFSEEAVARWNGIHHHRLCSMQALDEGLGKMMEALEETGQLENTIIMFTSDHGFSLGQHRHFGKRFPYDRITKVPFIARGPGVPAGQQCDQLLANIDIAPTLVDLANGKRPAAVDGLSFASLLRNPQQKIGRPGIILENWDRIWTNRIAVEAAYTSLRTQHHIYTEWASGSFEYYDLQNDPDQLNNLYPQLNDEKRRNLDQALREARARENRSPVFAREITVPELYEERMVFSANFAPAPFTGFVEDDDGVQNVELEIYCDAAKSWWDGTRWSPKYATVPADLSMEAGHLCRWSYNLDTSSIAFDKNEPMYHQDVVMNAMATDVAGNQTRWDQALRFRINMDAPETWIDTPEPWSNFDQPLQVTGRAADNFKVARVELLVIDLDRKLFWNGEDKKWVSERFLNHVEMKPAKADRRQGDWVEWSFQFDGPPVDQLFLCPRAFDDSEKTDMSAPFEIVVPVVPKK